MVPALPPDRELVQSLLARDEDVFAQVVRAWSPAMLRLARYHVRSRAVAEEVVQEAWVAVVKQLAAFEGRSALRTWVLRICSNIARRSGAKEDRSVPIGMPGEPRTVDPDRFRGPDDQWPGHWKPSAAPIEWGPEIQLMSAETRRVLTEALLTLPERQAHVVALRDIHGLPTEEVADLLGISAGNVRVVLHRARAQLRQQLATHYTGEVGFA